MKKQYESSKAAILIGLILSELIAIIGIVMILTAVIIILSKNHGYTFEPSFTVYETEVIMMLLYGICLDIAALIAFCLFSNQLSNVEAKETGKEPESITPITDLDIRHMEADFLMGNNKSESHDEDTQ